MLPRTVATRNDARISGVIPVRLKTAAALLTAGEEIDLARRVHGTDPADSLAARNELVLRNLGLVGKAAAYYRRKSGLDYDDLFSEGMLALVKAAGLFDPARHCRFSSFAYRVVLHWVKNVVLRSALVRVPNYLQNGQHRVTPRQGAARAANRGACLSSGQMALAPIRSLGDQHDLPDPGPQPSAALIAHEDADALYAALARMHPMRAYVLAHRRGLCGLDVRSLDAIGREFGLCRERIRQIEVLATDDLTVAMARLGASRVLRLSK